MIITQHKFLSDIELKRLLDQCHKHKGERDSIFLRMCLYTGARQSEVLAIRACDFQPYAVTIYGKKKSNDRTIPLDPNFYAEVMLYIQAQGFDKITDRIFPISTRMARYIWDAYRTNPRKGLHSTRHTTGVKLYNNCKDIKAVKTMLGHKNINNTQIYVDYVEGQEKLRTATVGMWDKPLCETA